MKIPYPPKPPEFYWSLPMAWRQRYCRWFVNPWWSVHRFCEKYLTRKYVLHTLPEIISFRWFCFKADMRDFTNEKGRKKKISDRMRVRMQAFVYACKNMKAYQAWG